MKVKRVGDYIFFFMSGDSMPLDDAIYIPNNEYILIRIGTWTRLLRVI